MKTYEERTQSVLEKAKKQRHSKFIKRTSIISCALALIVGVNLFLFLPYQTGGFDTTPYKDGTYYSIIQKLSGVTYGTYETTDNYTRLLEFLGISSGVNGEDGKDGAAGSQGAQDDVGVGAQGPQGNLGNAGTSAEAPTAPDKDDSTNNNYHEVTNNQVRGVTEGDLFKRSSEYIFYLHVDYPEQYVEWDKLELNGCTYTLDIYSIAGAQSEKVATYTVEKDEAIVYGGSPEIFLSKDGKTITVVAPCTKQQIFLNYTALITIDVSDIHNAKETNRAYISGSYLSSRMTDESFLLISNFAVSRRPNFSNEEEFIPQTGTDIDQMKSLPLKNIIVPEDVTTATYTVVCAFDGNMKMKGTEAFLSYSRDVYVSQQNVFVMRQYARTVDTKNQYQLVYSCPTTEIYCVSYSAKGLKTKGSFNVNGTILNRYCMDEYEGVFRVFTNLSLSSVNYVYQGIDPYGTAIRNNTCNLYCVDLESFETIASVENFAPANETIRSARFDGKTGYACTAITIQIYAWDPVYAFDLSDYDHITSTDTGTIAGFSSSLTKFSGDTLLGIGQGKWSGSLKIELYRETGTEVVSVAAFEIDSANFSSDYKAYYIDAEHGLIGLGVNYYDRNYSTSEYKNSYIVLRFDGYKLIKIAEIVKEGNYNYDRATYIEDCLYILGEDYFKVLES